MEIYKIIKCPRCDSKSLKYESRIFECQLCGTQFQLEYPKTLEELMAEPNKVKE